jgi:hypothetical protein
MLPKNINTLTFISILILFSTTLFAQVDSSKASQGVNINFFNGYAISYKWGVPKDINYRVYLSLSSNWDDDNTERENNYNGNLTNNRDYKNSRFNFSTNLSYQFLFNLISQNAFNLYLGIGPNLNYSYYKSESRQDDNNVESNNWSKSVSTKNSYGIGVISLVGIEVHLTKSITLFAETHLSGLKTWSDQENTSEYFNSNYDITSDKSGYSEESSGWSANLQLVKVGLGIYF